MRILITNDDGINAPGLVVLKRIAQQLAGADGDVWTVAPSTEQSGTSHCVSFVRPFLITEIGTQTFAVDGTPADCVLAGLYEIMQEQPPDLVLSGVNRGNNSGENALYSGTVGAVMEASLQGKTGIALSQYLGPANGHIANPFEAADAYGVEAVHAILTLNNQKIDHYPLFYNVNFPPCPADSVAGIRAAKQGARPLEGRFKTMEAPSPSNRKFLWLRSGPQDVPAQPQSDITLNLENFVSITPMRADLTDQASMVTLESQLHGRHD